MQLGGMLSQKAHMGIHFQNKEKSHIRSREEKHRGTYDGSGRFIMEIISYEVDVWEKLESRDQR